MGLQKFRADRADEPDANGAVAWRTVWMGGHTLAKVVNCPIKEKVFSARTVYTLGEPDTMFSIPAACKVRKQTIRGFLTYTDGLWQFNPYTAELAKLNPPPEQISG